MTIKLISSGNYLYVEGYTFPIITILKEHGFYFNKDKKRWERFENDPEIYYEIKYFLKNLNKKKSKRAILPNNMRCHGICKSGIRCNLKKRFGDYCKIHHVKYTKNIDFL